MLLHGGEAKILAAEEEESVEEDDGRIRPQLLTVPQKLLLHLEVDVTCGGEQRADAPRSFRNLAYAQSGA